MPNEPCTPHCPAGDCAGCAFPPVSCMGGFCSLRDACKHHLAADRRIPVDRMCEPKQSDAFEPIYLVRPWRSMVHQLERAA